MKPRYHIVYDGEPIGVAEPDLVIDDNFLLELKINTQKITPQDRSQLGAYMRDFTI